MTVLCVPHLASTSQTNPTHQRQRMQEAPAIVGNTVAEHGEIEGMKAKAKRSGLENFVFAGGRERRHGERLGARAFEGIGGDVAGNTDFVFGLIVKGSEVFVGDGPVVEGAAFESAVSGAHAEVLGLETPGHGSVGEGAPANASGVVAVVAVGGKDDAASALKIDVHAGIASVVGAGVVAKDGRALVAEIVFAAIVGGVPETALENNDMEAGLGKLVGDDTAAGSGSDDDRVHARKRHGSAFPGKLVLIPTADGNDGDAEHAPAHVVGIALMAGVAVEALHRVSADGVEEGTESVGKIVEEGSLLGEGEIGEGMSKGRAGCGIEGGDAVAIEGLEFLEMGDEVGVDVMDGAGFQRTRIMVAGDDLCAERLDGAGFGRGEETPGALCGTAGDEGGGSGRSGGEFNEVATRKSLGVRHGASERQ